MVTRSGRYATSMWPPSPRAECAQWPSSTSSPSLDPVIQTESWRDCYVRMERRSLSRTLTLYPFGVVRDGTFAGYNGNSVLNLGPARAYSRDAMIYAGQRGSLSSVHRIGVRVGSLGRLLTMFWILRGARVMKGPPDSGQQKNRSNVYNFGPGLD